MISKVEETELFDDDPKLAAQLWDAGFRPQQACTLQPDQTVAFVITWFGFPDGQPWQTGVIHSVQTDELGSLLVTHSGADDPTVVDECTEVWAK